MKRNLITLLLPVFTAASPLSEGWNQLLMNNIDSAASLFSSAAEQNSSSSAAKREGQLAINSYLYGDDSLAYDASEIFRLSSDHVMLAAHLRYLIGWSRDGFHKSDKAILSELNRASAMNSCISPMINELILTKEMGRGNLKKADVLKTNAGVVSQWHFIGPFENSAGSGFNTVYPPELGINKDSVILGKEHNKVRWSSVASTTPDPWIWVNNHAEGYDAVYYFAVSIHSAEEQPAQLSFGASGSFKIFLNGAPVMQDSLFRNTGMNSFLKPITLKKGVNTILVKIGYEDEKANFALALLDRKFKPLANTKILTELVDRREPLQPDSTSQTGMIDSVRSVFEQRISRDSNDIEALSALLSFLTTQDQASEAEQIIRRELKRRPNSGWLMSLLGNVLIRQGRMTEAGQAYRKAYELSPEGNAQWQFELSRISSENNTDALLKFLDESKPHHKKNIEWLTARMALYAETGKTAQAIALLDTLAVNFPDNPAAALVRHAVFAEAGQASDARKVLEKVLKKNPYNQTLTYALAAYLTQTGNTEAALKLYAEEILRHPESPRAYYLAASIFAAHKQYSDALPFVNKAIELTPNSSAAYRLKAQILQQSGDKAAALECCRTAVDVTSDDFIAWESQRELEGKPSWQALAPIPPVDSILKKALPWADSVGESAAILAYYDDIFRYPSKASRTRTFFLMHLADRKAIEEWQEYTISSGDPRLLTVLQALTLKKDGRRIPADRNRSQLVFKSLEPGDNILVEYTYEERTGAGMTGMIYGDQRLSSSMGSYSQTVRFITPPGDTIPWRITGDVPAPKKIMSDGFQITEFTSGPSKGSSRGDQFTPSDYAGNSKIIYSDFTSWNQIARWYLNLTNQKGDRNSMIRAAADSLFAGVTDPREKIRRTHHYITKNIAYSFVPFRQSGWVPQSTSEILATRIGDCKDMALLGRTLLRLGGIQAELVLVNTDIPEYIDGAYMGPNFDHAILAAPLDDSLIFIDLTASSSAFDALPAMDQGAMALLVTDSAQAPFMLPVLSAEERRVDRNMNIELKEDGSANIVLESEKFSIFASDMRSAYRFGSNRDRIEQMQKILQEDSKTVKVDSLTFEHLDTLGKSVKYRTVYKVDNSVSLSLNTALFRVPFPDQIKSSHIPTMNDRTAPITLREVYRWISSQNCKVTITYPKTWKLTSKPTDVSIKGDNLLYELKAVQTGNTITFERKSQFNLKGIYTPQQFKPIHEQLNKALLADNQELIFQKL